MNAAVNRLLAIYLAADGLLARLWPSVALFALRVALAIPFFRSGLTKWDGFLQLSAGTRYLFSQEFRLHAFGAAIPYPAPDLMAFLSGVGEIVLPVLLVLGLFTRFSALGILVMTIVIQLTVPDGFINFHLPWAAMALALIAFGSGRLALDTMLEQVRVRPSSRA